MRKTTPRLAYFDAAEFRGWYGKMDRELLERIDEFRGRWGFPVIISPAAGAIGRHLGPSGASYHNVDRYGSVMALDVMPKVVSGQLVRGCTVAELHGAYQLAVKCGFTGIGVYPDWQPYPGLHLDVRPGRSAGDPATWSGLHTAAGQRYFSVAEAWA